MQEENYRLSENFDGFKNWIKNSTKSVYYKDIQYNLSSKGDGAFYSLELIFKKTKSFSIGNSGVNIIIQDSIDSKPIPFNLNFSEKYPAALVDGWFDVENYNPSDFKMKFKLASFFYNLSDEQIMANMINVFVMPLDKDETAIQRFIEDLKNHTSVKEIIVDEKEKGYLTKISQQIKEQTGKESYEIIYDLYIKRKEKDIEEQKRNK